MFECSTELPQIRKSNRIFDWWQRLSYMIHPYFLETLDKSKYFREMIESHPQVKEIYKLFKVSKKLPTILTNSELKQLLNHEEQNSITKYTLGEYKEINQELLQGICIKKCFALYESVRKIPKYNGLVFRLALAEHYPDFLQESGYVKARSFFSTTRLEKDAAFDRFAKLFNKTPLIRNANGLFMEDPIEAKHRKSILMIIKSKTGRSIENLSSLSRYESEVLILPGSVFRIVAKPVKDQSGRNLVFLEEVDIQIN